MAAGAGFGRSGGDVEDATRAVAILGGKAAGEQVDALDGGDVDDAEGATLDVLEVEGIVELESVEEDEDLFVFAAADRELGGEVARGDAGQARHRPVDILAEMRDCLNLLFRQRLPGMGFPTHDGEAARRHRHGAQLNRSGDEGDLNRGGLAGLDCHRDVPGLEADVGALDCVVAGGRSSIRKAPSGSVHDPLCAPRRVMMAPGSASPDLPWTTRPATAPVCPASF